jgi:hypothetical protein
MAKPKTPDLVTARFLCEQFNCDRRTMENLLFKIEQSHQIRFEWNGRARYDYKKVLQYIFENRKLVF